MRMLRHFRSRRNTAGFKKTIRQLSFGLLFLSIAAGTAVPRISYAESVPNNGRIVVMISVDGLAADYLDDPKAEMPTIRALAREGARAASMKAVTPTVTWPNHTTLVTGVMPARHGVVGNNYFDRATRKRVVLISDPVYDKDEIVKVPTIYDLAKAAGLKTAAIRWPASRNAKTLDWTLPDVRSIELLEKYSTPSLFAEAEAAGIKMVDKTDPGSAAGDKPQPADDVCVRVFNLILSKHRPNLALLHLVDVDHDEHLYGPRTPEAYAAIKIADKQVREVWDELKRDFPGKASLLIVSDHGFSANERVLLPNVVLRQAGLVESSGKNKTTGPVQVVVQGGSALIYILDDAHRAEISEKIRKAFENLEGVSKVVGTKQLHQYGVATPKEDPHAPDMILFGKDGCIFGDTASGDLPFNAKPERKGSHGHDPSIPHLHAVFVAWGAGIKTGATTAEIPNTVVAPTIAKLLGISMPNVEDKPLSQVLSR